MNVLTIIIVYFIKFYQFSISPFIGSNCRFTPTCSNYAIQSLQEKGLIRGLFFSLKRLLKCHPWGGSGFDPIRKK